MTLIYSRQLYFTYNHLKNRAWDTLVLSCLMFLLQLSVVLQRNRACIQFRDTLKQNTYNNLR